MALFVFIANHSLQRFFADVAHERRHLHTIRAAALLAVQAQGPVPISLIIFGAPNNFGTVLALAGAAYTVALKDFVVGFISWFVSMGKDGIRPADWVDSTALAGKHLKSAQFTPWDWKQAVGPTPLTRRDARPPL